MSIRVHGYTGDVGHQTARTVNAVMVYDDPKDRQTFMLIVQQALLIPKLKQVLLCPNQMCNHGLRANDEPKFTLVDRIPSTTPGAEPPRDTRDSGSARSHSTHLETSSSDRP